MTQPVSIFEIGFIKNMRLFAFTLSIIPYILFSQPRSVHTYQPGIDVLNYEFTLDLPDTGRSIEGYAVITLVRTAPATTLKLDLLNLRVDTVSMNGHAAR